MATRLYPEYIPSFTNEPTADRVAVIQTGDRGEGLIALTAVKAGEIVFSFSGVVIPEQTLFTLQDRAGSYVHDPFVMGKVLHCCEPNMECNMENRTFYALRDIEPGEFLTMDYETTEDELYRPFICGCGAPGCRGVIRGRKFQTMQLHTVAQSDKEAVALR